MFCLIFLLGHIVHVTELMARLCKFRTINIQTITLTVQHQQHTLAIAQQHHAVS
jgi:hypothetical protein